MLLRPAESHQGPRPGPVIISLAVHLCVLASVALAPAGARKRQSAYQREIAPHEKKLVWYRFKDKLPDVAPPKRECCMWPSRPASAGKVPVERAATSTVYPCSMASLKSRITCSIAR